MSTERRPIRLGLAACMMPAELSHSKASKRHAPPPARPSTPSSSPAVESGRMAAIAATAAPVLARAAAHPARRPAAARPSPRSAFVARRPAQRAVRVFAADPSVKAGKLWQAQGFRGASPAPHSPLGHHSSGTQGGRAAVEAAVAAAARRPPSGRLRPSLPLPPRCAHAGAGAVTDGTWEELVLKSPVPVLVSR